MKDFLEFIKENYVEPQEETKVEEKAEEEVKEKVNESAANYEAVGGFQQTEEYKMLQEEYHSIRERLESAFEVYLEEHPEFGLDPGDSDFDQSIDVIMGDFEVWL